MRRRLTCLFPFRKSVCDGTKKAMSTRVIKGEFETSVFAGHPVSQPDRLVTLTHEHEAETLKFLAARPIHTVFVASLISDNGMTSPFHRGTIYGFRNSQGSLEGVALIGHATILETKVEECTKAFAHLARSCPATYLIRGEEEQVRSFWKHYSNDEIAARLVSREFLLTRRAVPTNVQLVPGLRQATLADLEMIVAVNGSLAYGENGTNPLTSDTAGFRARSARRIRQGRSWVLVENNHLIFKTDVIAQTPQVAYLEGVYVDPEKRGQGYGFRCLSQLTEYLLMRVGCICLTVSEKSPEALAFYKRAGFGIASRYDTIYLQ